jgi:hypothetical protein
MLPRFAFGLPFGLPFGAPGVEVLTCKVDQIAGVIAL